MNLETVGRRTQRGEGKEKHRRGREGGKESETVIGQYYLMHEQRIEW